MYPTPSPPRPPRAQLDRGMPVDFAGNWGRTALWYACSGNQPAAALLLLENRADPNRVDKGLDSSTPLHLAAHRGHKEIVALLLQYGADAKKQNTNNRTAYDLARFERWGFPALQKRETARLLEAWAAAPVGVPVVEGNAFGDRRVEFTSSLATIDALASLLAGAGLEDRATTRLCAAALTSRGFDGTRASLLLADEQGVLRTVLGHHDDYDRVREKLLVARKVALGVAVGRSA